MTLGQKIKYSVYSEIRWFVLGWMRRISKPGETKIFCIGRNKTGTTSLKTALRKLGFDVGNQRGAEILFDKYYLNGKFSRFLNYCHSAQAFQDVPFSLPETYRYLDKEFPGAKFILTMRDNPDQWAKSLTNSHAKRFGKDGRVPTFEDMEKSDFIRPGFWTHLPEVLGTTKEDPYNRELLVDHYNAYNSEVISYFSERPEKLLVINVAEPDAFSKLTEFLEVQTDMDSFPWRNKT